MESIFEQQDRKLGAWIGGIVLILVVGVFIFPGLWVVTPFQGTFARVNRITGTVEYASEDGWISTKEVIEKARAFGIDKPITLSDQFRIVPSSTMQNSTDSIWTRPR